MAEFLTDAHPKPRAQEILVPAVAAWLDANYEDAEFWAGVTEITVGGSHGPRERFSINILAGFDVLIVNAYTEAGFFSQLMPVSEHGFGMQVPIPHPLPAGWADVAFPALAAVIDESIGYLKAHREGRVCGAAHPEDPKDKNYGWACNRPAGHDQLEGWRAVHAMSPSHLWDANGAMHRR